jgi:hypothetical protein
MEKKVNALSGMTPMSALLAGVCLLGTPFIHSLKK